MDYDVALALLEEAALLLDEGRTEEVKVLAGELAGVFRSIGSAPRSPGRSAALSAGGRAADEATVELARTVLRYLFRARHDQGLRFTL
jgi:hypothetical protein